MLSPSSKFISMVTLLDSLGQESVVCNRMGAQLVIIVDPHISKLRGTSPSSDNVKLIQ